MKTFFAVTGLVFWALLASLFVLDAVNAIDIRVYDKDSEQRASE